MADFRARVKEKLANIFGCDLRSLAAFRIALAVLIFLDLGDRARDLRAHYTDWGVLPRGALIDLFLHPSAVSIHFMNGTWQFQLLLFVVAFLFAAGLLVGYRTRLMTVVSWVLLVSLQNRNPLVLQGGDILFRMILFWAMFLPLGARWSLDAYRSCEPLSRTTTILSVATVAILVQAVLLYVLAGVLKTGPEWTRDYSAVYYAMSIDQLTTPVGHWLLRHPDLMKALTYLTIKIEIFGPLLFFIPFFTGFFRLAAILLLFGMQMGFGAAIRVYIFPWICFAATLPLVPSSSWDFLSRFFRRTKNANEERPASEPIPTSTPLWQNAIAAIFLLYVLLWNFGTLPQSLNPWRIDVPHRLKWLASALRIDQQWNMFAPYPLKDDGWYVIPGTLKSGREADIFRNGKPVSWEKPERIAYEYKNQRWQKYMMNLWSRDFSKFREFYGKYLCRSWNERHKGGEKLDRFTIYFMKEDTLPQGEAPPEKISLWEHYCFKMPEKD